jgi:hypothetical protein
MGLDLTLRRDTESPAVRSWIVVAMLLVLHWSAPGAISLQGEAAADAPGGFYSPTHVSQPGSLLRGAARIVAFEAHKPKSDQKHAAANGKYAALNASDSAAALLVRAALATHAGKPAPRTAPSRGFDARGPPRATA